MILLDTNYLIRQLIASTTEARRVLTWLTRDEALCTSAIAWYEFLSGPVDLEGIDIVRETIADRVMPFIGDTAAAAARLFNSTGRVRRRRVDAMIAATAILAGASLATQNADDFRAFRAEGLHLV